jgi:hypothetical protein
MTRLNLKWALSMGAVLASLALGWCLRTVEKPSIDISISWVPQEVLWRRQALAKKLLDATQGNYEGVCRAVSTLNTWDLKTLWMSEDEVRAACSLIVEQEKLWDDVINKPVRMTQQQSQVAVCEALSAQKNTEKVKEWKLIKKINRSRWGESVYDQDFYLITWPSGISYELKFWSKYYEIIFPWDTEHPETFEWFVKKVKTILSDELRVKSRITWEIKDRKFMIHFWTRKSIPEMTDDEFVSYFVNILSWDKVKEWFWDGGAIKLAGKIMIYKHHWKDLNRDKCDDAK